MNKLIALSVVSLASIIMLAQGMYYNPYPMMTYSYSSGRGMMGGVWEFLVFIIILIVIASIFDFNGQNGFNGGGKRGY